MEIEFLQFARISGLGKLLLLAFLIIQPAYSQKDNGDRTYDIVKLNKTFYGNDANESLTIGKEHKLKLNDFNERSHSSSIYDLHSNRSELQTKEIHGNLDYMDKISKRSSAKIKKKKIGSVLDDNSMGGSRPKRHLQDNTLLDASMSIISGSGIQDFDALEQKTIVIEPRDSSNVAWGPGYDIYIQISNRCTYNITMLSCDINSDAEDVINYQYALMTDNKDGTYSHNFTIEKPGIISVYMTSSFSHSINATVYTGTNFNTPPSYENWTEINRPWESVLHSGWFRSKFRSPTCAPIKICYCYNDGIRVVIDGIQVHNDFGDQVYTSNCTTLQNTDVDQFHSFELQWSHFDAHISVIKVNMSYATNECNPNIPGQSLDVIPGENWYHDVVINPTTSLPYNITVTCPDGYEQNTTTDKCVEVAGNGFRTGSEVCDDGNSNDGDGCSTSTNKIEEGYVCYGGSPTSKDQCEYCNSTIGWYPNDQLVPEFCVSKCGDGKKASSDRWAGSERCDDGDTNDEGCSSDCTHVVDSYVCRNGTPASPSYCELCIHGYYPDQNQEYCTRYQCGDGYRVVEECCDDGNTRDGDGCDSLCRIETSYECHDGNGTKKDNCTICNQTIGWYPDNNTARFNTVNNTQLWFTENIACPVACTTICGDSKEQGDEACEDGNTNDGDGCNHNCTVVENLYVCTGGSGTSKDTCTRCEQGEYQDNTTHPEFCVSRCSDGYRMDDEECDDGNDNDGDGCSSDCYVEEGWHCVNESSANQDKCTMCETMLEPNSDKNKCEAKSQNSVIGYFVLVLAIIFITSSIVFNSIVNLKDEEAMENGGSCVKTRIQYLEPILILQTLILLPMLNMQLNEQVLSFYRAIRHLLFSFSFLSIDISSFGMSSSDKTDNYLLLIDIKSHNSIANIFQLMLVFAIFIVLLLILQLLTMCLKRYRECLNSISKFVLIQIIQNMLFMSYAYLLAVSIIQIINSSQDSDVLPTISSTLVIAYSVGLHVILLLNCVKTCKDCNLKSLCNKNDNEIDRKVSNLADKDYIWPKMLYYDLPPTLISSFYPLFMYSRLTLSVVVICLSQISINSKFGIRLFLVIQIQMMLVTLFSTKFKSLCNFIIQTISYSSMMLALLIHYSNASEESWDNKLSVSYTLIIMGALMVINMVVIKEIVKHFVIKLS